MSSFIRLVRSTFHCLTASIDCVFFLLLSASVAQLRQEFGNIMNTVWIFIYIYIFSIQLTWVNLRGRRTSFAGGPSVSRCTHTRAVFWRTGAAILTGAGEWTVGSPEALWAHVVTMDSCRHIAKIIIHWGPHKDWSVEIFLRRAV